jgi:hypothetical protein
MIQELVTMYEANKDNIRFDIITELSHHSYASIEAERLVAILAKNLPILDYENITTLKYGDYQGTCVFVIPERGYSSYRFYVVKYDYGSCSGCDTLEALGNDIDGLMNEVLHLVQNIKEI